MFRKTDTHIHFVGIGGIGMSGIAELLLNLGYRVTGTDLASTEVTRRLAHFGAIIHQGHDQSYLGDADVVVISSAVHASNPEVVAARQRKIPVIPRAEMLAELMRLKQGIAIAGSHGKTTTTSLIASVLHAAGIDPTVVIGGKLNAFGSNAYLGSSDVLVAEADESDGSFLCLNPTIAVITNIDHEHLSHYGNFDQLCQAFTGFANRVPFYGMAVVCIDDKSLAELVPHLHKRTITYGFHPDADYRAFDLEYEGPTTRFRVEGQGRDLGQFCLHMPGVHNVRNALAAIAVCDGQEVDQEVMRSALANFSGVQRRFTIRGAARGMMIVDDYGHHPTEIHATLSGARISYPHHRIIAVVQPHRYSRVQEHFADFVSCLDDADVVFFTDIYAAGEQPIPGVSIMDLVSATRARKPERPVFFEANLPELTHRMKDFARSGDLLITLGAGSISQVSKEFADYLQQQGE